MTDFSQITLTPDQRAKLIDELAAYAETDLLCYFAEEEALYARQLVQWEPVLQWAEAHYGVAIARTQGVMPVAQPPELRAQCHAELAAQGDGALVAMAQLITQLGSVLLAQALLQQAISPDDANAAAQLDEAFQAEEWGDDPDRQAERSEKQDKIRAAYAYLISLGDCGGLC